VWPLATLLAQRGFWFLFFFKLIFLLEWPFIEWIALQSWTKCQGEVNRENKEKLRELYWLISVSPVSSAAAAVHYCNNSQCHQASKNPVDNVKCEVEKSLFFLSMKSCLFEMCFFTWYPDTNYVWISSCLLCLKRCSICSKASISRSLHHGPLKSLALLSHS